MSADTALAGPARSRSPSSRRRASPSARLPRFLSSTGTPSTIRSTGAGTISTVTSRLAASRSRTPCRPRPTVTIRERSGGAAQCRPARSSLRCSDRRQLSGPTTSTVAGSDGDASDFEARRGLAVDRGHDRHRTHGGRLEGERQRGRRHLHHLDAERRLHVARRRWNSARPGRALRRSSTATISPRRSCAQRADGRAPHVDDSGRLADDLELRRDVLRTRAALAARAPLRAARPPATTATRPAPIDSTFRPRFRKIDGAFRRRRLPAQRGLRTPRRCRRS